MKAYFFNLSQIARMAEIAENLLRRQNFDCTPISASHFAEKIASELDDAGSPIELDEASLSELDGPCKFVPKADIVGFVTKDGALKGVFVKE